MDGGESDQRDHRRNGPGLRDGLFERGRPLGALSDRSLAGRHDDDRGRDLSPRRTPSPSTARGSGPRMEQQSRSAHDPRHPRALVDDDGRSDGHRRGSISGVRRSPHVGDHERPLLHSNSTRMPASFSRFRWIWTPTSECRSSTEPTSGSRLRGNAVIVVRASDGFVLTTLTATGLSNPIHRCVRRQRVLVNLSGRSLRSGTPRISRRSGPPHRASLVSQRHLQRRTQFLDSPRRNRSARAVLRSHVKKPLLLLLVFAAVLAGGATRIVQDQCGPFTDVTPGSARTFWRSTTSASPSAPRRRRSRPTTR